MGPREKENKSYPYDGLDWWRQGPTNEREVVKNKGECRLRAAADCLQICYQPK